MTTSFSRGQLQINTKTWLRDSFGLFDYETLTVKSQTLNTTGPCGLARTEDKIVTASNFTEGKRDATTDLKDSPIPLATVYDSPDGISIASTTKDKDSRDDFWMVVESGESMDGYKLKVNDLIRIGRVCLKISQIKTMVKDEDPTLLQRSIIRTIKEYLKDNDTNNRYIGEEVKEERCMACINNLSQLKIKQGENIINIRWKNIHCKVCRQKVPINMTQIDEKLSRIPIKDKISGSYVIMKHFSMERELIAIHLIDLSSNRHLKMGRGRDCDLVMKDISVSRVHSLLVVSKGNLYLKDNLSKFGTLVLYRGPVIVNDEMPVSPWIQCGRTVFKFSLKQSWLARIPCVGSLFGFNKTVKLEDKLLEEETERGDRTAQYPQEGDGTKRLNTRGEHE